MNTVAMYVAYMLAGALSGLLSGLFGIAGGLIMVPTLLVCFAWTGVAADAIGPSALGTSLAAILFTNGLSSWFNHRQKALREPFSRSARFLSVALGLGVTAGTVFSTALPRTPLIVCIAVLQAALSAWLMRSTFFQPAREATTSPLAAQDRLPPWSSRAVMATTGFLSAVGGTGGSSLLVPFLRSQGIDQRESTAFATYLSCIVGAAGFIGYGLLAKPHTPLEQAIGYVHVPALVCMVAGSVLLVRLGTQLSGRIRPVVLTRSFCVLLMFSASRMLLPLLAYTPSMS